MKRRNAFKNRLTTLGLYCLSFFLIIVGFIFALYWFMWVFSMVFLMYMGVMLMGLGGYLMFWLYMNKSNYYNKPY